MSSPSDSFIGWLSDHDAIIGSCSLVDDESTSKNRYMVASADIQEGELLFSIPRHLLLHPLSPKLAPAVVESINEERILSEQLNAIKVVAEKQAHAVEDDDDDEDEDIVEGPLNNWTLLILCMMAEALIGDASYWTNYLRVLPTEISTPLFWPESDLDLLRGSSVITHLGIEETRRLYDTQISPYLKAIASRIGSPVEDLGGFPAMLRMGSLVGAYAFEEFGGHVTMVPLADMLNSITGRNNARLFYTENALEMRAIKTISAGEELINTYGDLSNAELLRRYGFSEPNNPFDTAELPVKMVLDAVKSASPNFSSLSLDKRVTVLKNCDLGLDISVDDCPGFDLCVPVSGRPALLPEILLYSLHVLCATNLDGLEAAELDLDVVDADSTCIGSNPMGEFESNIKEAAVLDRYERLNATERAILSAAITALLDLYSNDHRLTQSDTDIISNQRVQYAKYVVDGERSILQGVLAALHGEPTLKRRRQ